jgi:hypothetical protein
VSEIGGFRDLTKTPEALLMVGTLVAIAMAWWSYANFDSGSL